MKVLLAVGAVLVALATATVSGSMLTATSEEPAARVAAASPEGNPAAREFVAAKKEWTACVKAAAPAAERACGRKPHPHDDEFGKHGRKHHGPPAWAGGPDRRTAEPPGHAKRD